MTIAPSTIARAWGDFYASAPLKVPVTEGEYLEFKELADYLLDEHNVEAEPYVALFDLVTDYMDRWERANEPELKDVQVPPHQMLAHYMEQQGVTQYQLDKEGVVSQGNLSAILKGRRGVSLDLAKRLAERFKVSVEVFI